MGLGDRIRGLAREKLPCRCPLIASLVGTLKVEEKGSKMFIPKKGHRRAPKRICTLGLCFEGFYLSSVGENLRGVLGLILWSAVLLLLSWVCLA